MDAIGERLHLFHRRGLVGLGETDHLVDTPVRQQLVAKLVALDLVRPPGGGAVGAREELALHPVGVAGHRLARLLADREQLELQLRIVDADLVESLEQMVGVPGVVDRILGPGARRASEVLLRVGEDLGQLLELLDGVAYGLVRLGAEPDEQAVRGPESEVAVGYQSVEPQLLDLEEPDLEIALQQIQVDRIEPFDFLAIELAELLQQAAIGLGSRRVLLSCMGLDLDIPKCLDQLAETAWLFVGRSNTGRTDQQDKKDTDASDHDRPSLLNAGSLPRKREAGVPRAAC